MPNYAANISMLFTEYPFVERIDRAAAAGFRAIEFQFPYAEDVDGIAQALANHGMTLALFNLPAGDFAAGDRGIANNPTKRPQFRDGVARGLELAQRFGCAKINCLVGMRLPDVAQAEQWATVEENLAFAAEAAQKVGVLQVVEPLNGKDNPGFLLTRQDEAFDLVRRIGHPNLKVQYDLFHAQRMEGNLIATMREHFAEIGHIQLADSPDRHEPGTGEINFPNVLAAIDALGYTGWVGLEYRPSRHTEESFGWMADLQP